MRTPPAFLAAEHWVSVFRRRWWAVTATSLAVPLLYLLSIGLGLGQVVDRSGASAELGDSYLAYVFPGLMIGLAAQVAFSEGTWPVMGALRWNGVYQAMQATPLSPAEIFAGHFLWVMIRSVSSTAVFVLVATAVLGRRALEGLAALPVALVLAATVGALVMAFSISRRRSSAFSSFSRLVYAPLFLFSGIFFPMRKLGHIVELASWANPVWNAVEAARHLFAGRVGATAAAHVVILFGWLVAGCVVAVRQYHRALVA